MSWMRFWPSPVDLVIGYSSGGALFAAIFAISALLGLAGGFALWRRRATGILCGLVAVAFFAAAALHLAVVVTLVQDPSRDLGRIPLPPPFAEGAAWLSIALTILSPGVAAFVVTRLFLAFPPFPAGLRVAALAATIYAASVGPWAGYVLFD
jgi:hypothetical protein